MIPDLYILNTYGMNNPDEGLSVVYHSIKHLGIEINNSIQLNNKKVFVAGICYMYTKLLNQKNINIIYTTYEFCPIPDLWVQLLNTWYSIIIVPHPAVKKMFIDSGVKKPIFVVQQGFPLRKYILPVSPKVSDDSYTIGFLGVPAKRKNLELLIETIEHLKHQIPQIILKVHISKYYSEMTPIVFPDNKHFEVSYGYKSDNELNKWYSALDSYIFPSSGEGWSFTPRESLSLGIPTIISNCLVHRDLNDYCKMIELPITVDKIETSIIEVYKNYNYYKETAEKGKIYVSNYNRNDNMINFLSKIIIGSI